MKTTSLRRRITALTFALLAGILIAVMVLVTFTYHSALQNELRRRLLQAADRVNASRSVDTATQLESGLALQGISTAIDRSSPAVAVSKHPKLIPPVKTGISADRWAVSAVLPNGVTVTFRASPSQITGQVNRLIVLETLVGISALLAAGILARWTTASALRPLNQVVTTASAIARGDTGRRLQPSRTDTEIGAMSAAFDDMVDSLDIALRSSRDAQAALQRFVADASHELRTPIAALHATAERLLREQPDRPERDEIEAELASRAVALGRLVGDLLDLARLDGATHKPTGAVRLDHVIRDTVRFCGDRPAAPPVSLHLEPLSIPGDANALSRAIRNLIDNALAAAQPTGNVEVTLRSTPTSAQIIVIDDGPGVPLADRDRIFERFTRLHGEKPGAGLGLAIARRIAQQHGGDVTCDDTDHGAAFTLHLPNASI